MKSKLALLLAVISLLGLSSFKPNSHSNQDSQPKLIAYFIDVGEGDAIFLDIPPKDCMLIDAD